MILRIAATFFICSILCANASSQERKVGVLPTAPAKLVFYRATGYAGHSMHASIKIDSEKASHKVSDNRTWTTELPAGAHFVCGDDKQYGRTYELEGGKTYYFRIEAIMGENQLKFRVLRVSADTADTEMTGLQVE